MRNPDAVDYECPDCGARTKANKRRGNLYSHQVPGAVKVCSASGRRVLSGRRGGGAPQLPPLRPEPAPPVSPVFSDSGPSSSVRTVSGGLPTLGKRRR